MSRSKVFGGGSRGRQNRVVPAPVAGVKPVEVWLIQPDRPHRQFAGDGGKTNSSPGRARHKPLKPLRGESRVFRRTCGHPCAFLCTRLRVSRGHPAFPAPSFSRGHRRRTTSGALRAARSRCRIRRHLSKTTMRIGEPASPCPTGPCLRRRATVRITRRLITLPGHVAEVHRECAGRSTAGTGSSRCSLPC